MSSTLDAPGEHRHVGAQPFFDDRVGCRETRPRSRRTCSRRRRRSRPASRRRAIGGWRIEPGCRRDGRRALQHLGRALQHADLRAQLARASRSRARSDRCACRAAAASSRSLVSTKAVICCRNTISAVATSSRWSRSTDGSAARGDDGADRARSARRCSATSASRRSSRRARPVRPRVMLIFYGSPCPSAPLSPESPGRTDRTSPSCCSPKGYEVVGTVRRSSAPNFWRIQHLLDRITLKPADLLDQLSLIRAGRRGAAARALQPRGDVVRAGVVGSADADRRVQRAGRDARARGDPPGRSVDPHLSGLVERDVRQGARGAADRADAVLSAQPVRRVEGVRALHHGQLPRELRPVRRVGHAVQPRVAAPRPRVRHAQGDRRRRADQARPRRHAVARQPRRAARLGLRRRLRRARCG